MILDRLIDKVGNSNPQIFRELKERLTLRNIGIAIAAAIVIQGLVLLYFNGQIPVPMYDDTAIAGASSHKLIEKISDYCLLPNRANIYNNNLCKLNETGNYLINWQIWWSDVFTCLSWILPLELILGSFYMLVADLVQEEKRGTLNFIRLTPQSARQIFIGKILGVPILVYLATAAMLPLHLFVGITAGGSLPLLASWYVAIGSLWFLLSSAAVLYVLLGGIQAILTVIAIAYPICLPLIAINNLTSATIDRAEWLSRIGSNGSWFGLPVFGNAILFDTFGVGCCLVASYWIWQALERRYLNPTETNIGKSQAHLGLFLNVRKRNVWIMAIVGGVILLPLVGALILSPNHTPTGMAAILLLFSPFASLGIMQLGGGTILAMFAAQLVMFAALTHQLKRKLQIVGQSPTKRLLSQT